MKSVEWAKLIANEKECVEKVFIDFQAETAELVRERTKNSKSEDYAKPAREGALREQRQKWAAACRKAGKPELESFALTGLPKDGSILPEDTTNIVLS